MKRIFLYLLVVLPFFTLSSCKDTERKIASDDSVVGSKAKLVEILDKYYSPSYGLYPEMDAVEGDNAKEGNDYSKTNVQVNGIDEQDIVKTDGNHIYMVVQNKVQIIDAYPAENMALEKTITYDNFYYPTGLYVDDNYLVVIGNFYRYDSLLSSRYCYQCQQTSINIYDKNDYDKPLDTILLNGHLLTSRKTDNELVILLNQSIFYNKEDEDSLKLPEININNQTSISSYQDIHYHEGNLPNAFISLYKFKLDDIKNYLQYTYLGTYSDVYVSHDNVYMAAYSYYYGIMMDTVEGNSDTTTTKETSFDKSTITKINYTDALFGLSKQVEIEGRVLNQFAMDEYQNTFRVATTSGQFFWNEGRYSNLYIFDENMELLSKIDHIAEGESIQSARFMGDRIYIVTFRQVDPFFVIDTTDASNPKILGELKIPGFSTYLQPYDENHMIGFGFDTKTTTDNRIIIIGIKLSLYDVTNPTKPAVLFNELYNYEDNGYAYTNVNYDHKALLFSQDRHLIAFPFTLSSYEFEDNTYKYYYSQLYKVYRIDLEHGFTPLVDISHFDDLKENSYYYGYQILRGLYINNVLYTVSYEKVLAHDLTDFTLIKALDLDFSDYYNQIY